MSTGFTVVPPLGDGVEWLLTLHTQRDFLLPDGSRSSLAQLHAALRGAEQSASIRIQQPEPWDRVRIKVRVALPG